MKHIMLDLETMGNGPTAVIVAVGACTFDPFDNALGLLPECTFYRKVTLQSAVDAGLVIDPSTILWWMQQSDAARESTFAGAAESLKDALLDFNQFVSHIDNGGLGQNCAVWGNGATFDNVIIRSAFKAVSLTPSWSFRNDKCYRTVNNLLPKDRQPVFVKYGTAHNALDDAIAQALHLQKVYKALGL